MIIDFRLRPPYGSYLQTIMYRDPDFCENNFSNKMGMYQAQSVKKHSLELMLQEMNEAGITKAVIPGRKANPRMGVVNNKDIVELVEKYPDRFIGFPGIDPSDTDQAINEIEKLVIKGSCTGIVMEPGVLFEPMYSDDKRIYPIYEKCQELNIPVILMNGGNAGPDVSYSMPIAVDHIAVAFPKLKLIISHGGWPWVTEMLHVAWRRTNVFVSPDMYMVNVPGWQDYVTAANYILKDRFLFGTSYPFIPLKDGVEYFRKCGVKEELLPDLMYNNAAKLLGLE
ncbi:MAG: amidohydrolase family protein [Desulfitobacterium hafniense]|nr:amidohydrolase family protein [Desulfitobacterium hafniense]